MILFQNCFNQLRGAFDRALFYPAIILQTISLHSPCGVGVTVFKSYSSFQYRHSRMVLQGTSIVPLHLAPEIQWPLIIIWISLYSLYVSLEYLRNRIGSRLMMMAEKILFWGLKANHLSIAFYKKLGYKIDWDSGSNL